METLTENAKVTAVRAYQNQTTDTDNYYKHFGMILTDGVRFVADTLGAWWLVDIITTEQVRKGIYRQPFQVWEIAKDDHGDAWVRCWSDTPGKSTNLYRRKLDYTDFPVELMPFKLWVEEGVVLLPEEH